MIPPHDGREVFPTVEKFILDTACRIGGAKGFMALALEDLSRIKLELRRLSALSDGRELGRALGEAAANAADAAARVTRALQDLDVDFNQLPAYIDTDGVTKGNR